MKRNRVFALIGLGALFTLMPLAMGQGIITTIAGNGIAFPRNVAAVNAPVGNLTTVILDSQGNLYVADASYNMVFEISPRGAIRIVAGSVLFYGGHGFGGDGGPATSALLSFPTGLAVDASGNLFIADKDNGRVRKVSPNGAITTIAGGGTADPGDGGAATSASFGAPWAVAVDATGNLFVSDSGSNRICKVSTSGVITTIAVLNDPPQGLAVDASGNLFVASGNRVQEVSAGGVISTIAGNGNYAFSGDGGPATAASFIRPFGVAVDGSGNLFIAEYGIPQTGGGRVRLVSGGTVTTLAGNGSYGFYGDGGPATSASLFRPGGVAVDTFGNLFVADTQNNRIRKVSIKGVITTFAGNGTAGFSGDGGPATAASLDKPSGVAVDASGSVFIADYNNSKVRKVSADGRITTVASATVSGPLTFPAGVAVDSSGNLFVADNYMNQVLKVSPSGVMSIVAGVGGVDRCLPTQNCGDGGPATSALLARPLGVAVDVSGNLFIADTRNNRIRKVSTNGMISTVAGDGRYSFSGDGGPARSASVEYPAGVAADASGNLFIADFSGLIRKVSASGIMTTVVGPGDFSNYSLGYTGPATSAVVTFPAGVAVDANGDLFFTDGSNSVREVVADSSVPVVSANGIVNGASLDSPVIAPGEIVSVFGIGLGPQPGQSIPATGGFLKTSGADVSVTFDGTPAPLFYVSGCQINVQVPWELDSKSLATLLVTSNGKTGPPRAVQVQSFDPAIFMANGRMAIIDATGKQLTPGHPASGGSVLSIYATGLGAVDRAVMTGQLTPSGSLFKTIAATTVSVGGIQAPVGFAGLAPGFVGVYQVNFTLPHGLAAGDQPLSLSIGGSSTPLLPLRVR